MAKVNNLRKVLLTSVCALVLLVGSMNMCFAASTNPANTEVYVNVSATPLDFTVTESITLSGNANSTDLSADNIVVTNNSDIGVLNITGITAKAAEDWTIADQDTAWATLPVDGKTIGLVADGFDLAGGASYAAAGTVNPGATDTTSISGNTGMVTQDLSNVKAADITVTVGLK